MSLDCSIVILLDAEYSESTITKILQAGHGYQFEYNYHMWSEPYEPVAPFDISKITHRVMRVPQEQLINLDDSPAVFTKIKGDTTVTLWFYKTEYNQLKFNVGVFGAYCKKKEYRVDLGYYIPLFLSLCSDFSILEVKAEFI